MNFKYAIWTWGRRTICNKFVLNLEKMPQKRSKCFRLLLEYLAWIEHQFWSGIRDSRKAGSLWGMMRSVGGVRKSIHQSWLAKGLGLVLGFLYWGFKGVQEEIRSEEASTLQIGPMAFPPGQCTCPQLHPCHRLFDQVHCSRRKSLRRGLEFHVCTINKSAHTKKKSGNLSYAPRIKYIWFVNELFFGYNFYTR